MPNYNMQIFQKEKNNFILLTLLSDCHRQTSSWKARTAGEWDETVDVVLGIWKPEVLPVVNKKFRQFALI